MPNLTSLDQIRANALNVSFQALDALLYALGTQHVRGNYDEATYNQAEAEITADMAALSARHETITGHALAVFA